MNAPLRFTRAELMRSHPFERPHREAGYSLHGGFDAQGRYVSPRTLVRWPAVEAWTAALQSRGWALIDADTALLERPGYPNAAQQKLLLSESLGQTFWDSLTVTGIIEARGQGLCNFQPPDLAAWIVDDISETAAGHLNAGLLYAHGADEGGDPAAPGEGAHDAMWFAARDLAFGADAWPLAQAPDSIARDVAGREIPAVPEPIEQFIKFMMNVLMIEVRAESFFGLCQNLFRDPELFSNRRSDADTAAELVERIRTDEAIHVAYLRLLISEFRGFTWKTVDGGAAPGAEIIDPIWKVMVEWHGRTQRDLAADRARAQLRQRLIDERGVTAAAQLMTRLDSLEPAAAGTS
ncbi:MAG TPA: hypothetical protein VIC25_05020 [Caulobacteraceae bacterium]